VEQNEYILIKHINLIRNLLHVTIGNTNSSD